ncbi:TKL/TKL-ccin protein kinase [Coprinopsis cinerea AmutBmut pab1-1]|nr:TKL/TKL-ccin protein kinase [Coprinopsis cinerea AmutBmut pab1-1]
MSARSRNSNSLRTSLRAEIDPIFKDARSTDIVIPVMGLTGAGKSTFVNYLLGPERKNEHLKVGEGLSSCTAFVQPVVLPLNREATQREEARIVVVDTPGFDDTLVEDVDVLKRIAAWLATSYAKGLQLGGVIYLHDLSLDRFDSTSMKNLVLFKALCGQAAFDKVVLLTTKWGKFADEKIYVAESRENELKTKFWKELIGNRSHPMSFRPSQGTDSGHGWEEDRAWEVVDHILGKWGHRRHKPLAIQKELVDQNKLLPQTKAGKLLKVSMKSVSRGNRGKADPKIQEIASELKTPLGIRVRQMFGVYQAEEYYFRSTPSLVEEDERDHEQRSLDSRYTAIQTEP